MPREDIRYVNGKIDKLKEARKASEERLGRRIDRLRRRLTRSEMLLDEVVLFLEAGPHGSAWKVYRQLGEIDQSSDK